MVGALCGFTAAAQGATREATPKTSQAASASQDAESPQAFVQRAVQASAVGFRSVNLPRKRATIRASSNWATIVKDQQEIQARLKKIAQGQGIQQVESLQNEHDQQLATLKNASEAEFDGKFVEQMINDHQRDLAMLQEHSFKPDSELAQLVSDHRSTVQKHLELARTAAMELGLPTEGTATGAAAASESDTGAAVQRASTPASTGERDREILGLPTSNTDGTILGITPAPSATVEAGNPNESYIAEELKDGKIDEGVENIFDADQDTVAVPPTSEREKAAGKVVPPQSQQQQQQQQLQPRDSRVATELHDIFEPF